VAVAPDVVEGDVDGGSLTAGQYVGGGVDDSDDDVVAGQLINASARLPRVAYIRPSRPFGVNSASWSQSLSYTRGPYPAIKPEVTATGIIAR